MTMKVLLGAGVALGLALSLPGDTVAAQEGPYDLDWHSIAGGGETRSAGGDYELAGTIGQSTAGSSSGEDFQVDGGFMRAFSAVAEPPDDDYHPADVNRDGNVDALDIQIVINAVLGLSIDPDYDPDVNNDDRVDALDIQLVINVVLGVSTEMD